MENSHYGNQMVVLLGHYYVTSCLHQMVVPMRLMFFHIIVSTKWSSLCHYYYVTSWLLLNGHPLG